MRLARKSLSLVAAVLMSVGLMSPVAQAQAERVVAPEERDAYVQEFFQDGDVTPVVDGSGGLTDAEVDAFHQAVREAEQAGPLNDEIVAGEMLSDKIILPPQVDKGTSDEAEVAVAKQQAQPQMFATTAATCQYFPFSPHQVCGAILQRYNQMGGLLSILLDPIGRQIQNPDGVGFHQQFRNGFIFWHPDTGAHAITARNAEVFARNGWSAGWMGYPLGGEVPISGSNPIDGELNGWVQLFQGGRIYRSPVLEGFQVASINGLILDKWLQLGGHNSSLGLPIVDEAKTPDGQGRFSTFQFGTIYWHPNTGAYKVDSLIHEVWAKSGYELGQYGYPVSDSYVSANGNLEQQFQGGIIDLTESMDQFGYTNIAGKSVSTLLIDSLSRQGIPLEAISFDESLLDVPESGNHTRQLQSMFTMSDGGISIPQGYKYDKTLGSLNDYCTKSSDLFLYGLNVADFRGACARHDVCYFNVGEATESSYDYARCNNWFQDDLEAVCGGVYGRESLGGRSCLVTARGYYAAVVVAHPSHWRGHLNG